MSDEDVRTLERDVRLGREPVERLQAALRRAGRVVEAVNAGISAELRRVYRDPDTGEPLLVRGIAVDDIVGKYLWEHWIFEGVVASQCHRSGQIEGVRSEGTPWHPYALLISEQTSSDCCLAFRHSSYYRPRDPAEHFPCLGPWVNEGKGLKGRDGRVRAFVRNPPKGVMKIPRAEMQAWADAKAKTCDWADDHADDHADDRTFGGYAGARRDLLEAVASIRPRRWITEDSLERWLMLALDVAFMRAVNECVEGLPDLGPLVSLAGLSWRPWRDSAAPAEKKEPAGLARLPLDGSPDEAQAMVREALRLGPDELPPWRPPEAPGGHVNIVGGKCSLGPEPRPQMQSKYRRGLERRERRR